MTPRALGMGNVIDWFMSATPKQRQERLDWLASIHKEMVNRGK